MDTPHPAMMRTERDGPRMTFGAAAARQAGYRPPPPHPEDQQEQQQQDDDDDDDDVESPSNPTTPTAPKQAHTDKDSEIRLAFRDIPEDVDDYLRWRLMAKAKIVKVLKKTTEGTRWIEQVDLPGVQPHHFRVEAGDPYEPVEHAIYCALLEAMKGGMAVKLYEELSSEEVSFAHGRQALLCLDKAVYMSRYELSMLANSKLGTMQQNPLSGSKQLDEALTRYETLRKRTAKDRADLMITL